MPAAAVEHVARDLIQREVPVIECAAIHGVDFDAHADGMRRLASRHGVPVVVGTGWDPGALSLMRGLFAALIPKGNTDIAETAGIHTHHTTFEQSIPGVKRSALLVARKRAARLGHDGVLAIDRVPDIVLCWSLGAPV